MFIGKSFVRNNPTNIKFYFIMSMEKQGGDVKIEWVHTLS